MSRVNVETRWIKFGDLKDIIVLNEETIAIASGIHVMFFNLTTKEERIEKFDSPERGRGASCLAGHPVTSMFATAERRSAPKIYVFTFPGIRKVSSCVLEPAPNGYLSSIFAGTEYLITLASFPDFRLVVWSWRTGECLASIETAITDIAQKITCCSSSPYQISQLSETSGQLDVYEISVCSRIITISPVDRNNFVAGKNISSASWSADGNLVECDLDGNVILNFNDGKRRNIIVHGEERDRKDSKCDRKPLIETFRSGLILVDGSSRISFYKKSATSDNRVKSASLWTTVWSVQSTYHPIRIVRSPHRQTLLFFCSGGEIFELIANDDDDSPKIRTITRQGTRYKFLTTINPGGDHVVGIDESDRLSTFQSRTGQSISDFCLTKYGSVRCIASHPKLALIAIGTSTGTFVLINLSEILNPSIAKRIHLQREPFDKIRYSWSGCHLGIRDTARDNLFLVNSANDRYFVRGLFNFEAEIVDFLICKDEETIKILILTRTNNFRKIGNKLIVYSLDDSSNEKKSLCVFELEKNANSLYYGRNEHEIIVAPFLTKQLHFYKIQINLQKCILVEALSSGHQMRDVKLNVNENMIVTCSYDGLVIVRNGRNIQQVLTIFMAHHRLDGGALIAIIVSGSNFVVSIGRNGDLVATKICYSGLLEDPPELTDPTLIVFPSTNDSQDELTWIERRTAMKLDEEKLQSVAERNAILKDFSNLRERLKILLDANDVKPPGAQLPICDFDLAVESRKQKIQENAEEGKRLKRNLELEISKRDKASEYLKRLCWDSMEIQSCSLLSIDGKTKVDNFPMPRVDEDWLNLQKWQKFMNNFWSRVNKSEEKTKPNESNEISIIGTTTHRFIKEEIDRSVNQIQKIPSFVEGFIASAIVRDREQALKVYFNRLFENMRDVKERELMVAENRLEEIEHCASELKKVFNIDIESSETSLQPLWHYCEKPESIVTITDTEIATGRIATYLERDDRLKIEKKKEEERTKLNDSFREQALEQMMDGLLEVRWEDEIKKDPPRPSCLSSTDSSAYTDSDLAEIEAYKKKCDELEIQRQKYKKILENKIIEVKDDLKFDFARFDRRLEEFRLERMKIESAIFQETLTRLRESQRHLLRKQGNELVQLAHEELTLAIADFRKSIESVTNLENVVAEARNRYDNLLKREKMLDGKFRGEFADLKQPIVEHLLRHYRKRPRNVQLTCTSITYLTELGRCIVTCEHSEILPRDCSEFLHGLESLDVMPNNLPTQIDPNHWNILCKLRRARIELEMKIKICAVDLAEAEQTFVFHQKSCSFAESRVSQLRESITELETEGRKALEDAEIQLVLKLGQIECHFQGNPSDLEKAIFVPFFVVERANRAIIDAGREKLAAMRKTVMFRRTILWQEWRHECMRMTLENLREELKMLENVKVTREIQNYLLTDSRDIAVERKAKSYDRIVASTSKRFNKILEEQKQRFENTLENVARWSKKNEKSSHAVEKLKLVSFKTSMLIHDESRERDAKYREAKLKAIMKRTRLKNEVQENYGELLALQTQLELLRLKTYPTLRLKSLQRDKIKN